MAKSKKQKLKEKLWKLTSEYIRRRDHAEFQAGEGKGMAEDLSKCCTCGIIKPWKELQAGHFVARAQGLATYFDERNIHSQCFRCNCNLGGNGAEYYPFMEKKYGKAVIDELRRLSRTTVKFTEADYEEMIEETKKKLEAL
jgi:5-methylcytosine-specific restriction endonuclease McrA